MTWIPEIIVTPQPTLVVGNATAGDTLRDCDLLDTGDGAVLKAAIEAMSEGDWLFARAGTYDLDAGAASAIEIQQRTRITGEGFGTVIRNKKSGVQQIFTSVGSLEDCILENMRLQVSLPTGAGAGATELVDLDGKDYLVRGVKVEWDPGFTAVEAANLVIRISLYCSGGKLEHCWVEGGPSLDTLLGGTELINARGSQISRCRFEDADVGVIVSSGQCHATVVEGSAVVGVRMFGECQLHGCNVIPALGKDAVDASVAQAADIAGCELTGSGAGATGITLGFDSHARGNGVDNFDTGIATAQPECVISGNKIKNADTRAIDVLAGDDGCTVQGNVVPAGGPGDGIRISADRCTVQGNSVSVNTGTAYVVAGDDNVVNGNKARVTGAGATFSDTGTGNRVRGNGGFGAGVTPTDTTKTALYTAAVGDRVLYDPSGGTFTINAPSGPVKGDEFAVKNVTTSTTAVTIGGNGNSIEDPFTSTFVASFSTGAVGNLASLRWSYDGTNWVLV